MTTAIDTNVIVALWDTDRALNSVARSALDAALRRGSLIVPAPVFAELMACPGRDEKFVDAFFGETGIMVDWNLSETVWRKAGQAFQAHCAPRGRQRDAGPRRILADFLIGAYALQKGCPLLTLDGRLYRTAFPALAILPV
jgi:predicted nucleic acid-binding protein